MLTRSKLNQNFSSSVGAFIVCYPILPFLEIPSFLGSQRFFKTQTIFSLHRRQIEMVFTFSHQVESDLFGLVLFSQSWIYAAPAILVSTQLQSGR